VGANSRRLREALSHALDQEQYVSWDAPLPGLYVPQTGEIQLVQHSELEQCAVMTMANPREIHHWALRCSQAARSMTIFSAYLEPNGFWIMKLFSDGKPRWKSREEVDHEVPYPIPLANESNIQKSLDDDDELKRHYEAFGAQGQSGIEALSEVTTFLKFWGLPVLLPDDHRRREEIWLNKESPLVVNRMKERA